MPRAALLGSLLPLWACAFAACSRADHGSPAAAPPAQGPSLTTARGEEPPRESQASSSAHRPPPRRGIAGIAGFQSSSRVVYDARPEEPHMLSATYLFPERMRLRLSLDRGRVVERVMLYCFGERGFCIDERKSESRELAGEELIGLRMETEWRRALFLWPDGLTWREEGAGRSAELPGIGRLTAELGGDGRPTSLRSFDPAGAPLESVQSITWKKIGARHFPGGFELFAGSERICTEEVLEVETKLDYVDDYFLPPDRRGAAAPIPGEPLGAAIEAVDLPVHWELRAELGGANGAGLAAARSDAESARASWKARGIEVSDELALELDAEARPTAILLQASRVGDKPPTGWIERAECPAWSITLRDVHDADARRIAALVARRAGGPGGARPELHWIRTPAGTETVKLLLPQR